MSDGKRRPSTAGRNRTSSGRPVQKKKQIRKSSMPSKLKALILSLIALVVIVLVVLIAAGAFGGSGQKAAEKETETILETTEDVDQKNTSGAEAEGGETTEATTEATTEQTTTEAETVNENARTVYFSFNGKFKNDISEILDVLDKNNIKATFFINLDDGDNSVVKNIYDKGHATGVLQYDDDTSKIYESADSFKHDLNDARQAVFVETGELTDIYRFPGGSANDEVRNILEDCRTYIKELDMVYYDWNIDAGTANGAGAEEIAWNIENQIDQNQFKTNVVLIEEGSSAADIAAALDTVIPSLKEKGFEFASLSSKTPEMTFDIDL